MCVSICLLVQKAQLKSDGYFKDQALFFRPLYIRDIGRAHIEMLLVFWHMDFSVLSKSASFFILCGARTKPSKLSNFCVFVCYPLAQEQRFMSGKQIHSL